jgi:cytosine/adenosine deaminase-related metal-dependent hydrolase
MSTQVVPDLRSLVSRSPGGRVAVRLAAAADADRVIAPAVAVFDRSGPLVVDTPESVGRVDGPVVELDDHVAMPPLVNAHAHLDLTSVGALSFNGNFADWIDAVRVRRPTDADRLSASVREGVRRSVRGGTGFIGDIAGAYGLAAVQALREAAAPEGLQGIAYVEVFGIGRSADRGLAQLRELRDHVALHAGGIRLGVSPHAPYSCDDAVYAAAAAMGLPLVTHLSEAIEELQFVRDGTGPFVEFLRSFGIWTPELRGWGKRPVERVHPLVRGTGAALVHMNYLSDEDVFTLVRDGAEPNGCVPVYCPRASAYFRHPNPGHEPHRYRELLAAGVPVALGTDSAIVLGEAPDISVLDEMRWLWRRDGVEPGTLLAMATEHGARALGVPVERVRLPGPARGASGLIGVPVTRGASGQALLKEVLGGSSGCQWLWSVGPG